MNKKALQTVIQLTQECLTRYWQRDPEFALAYCDDEIVWVGSVQCQFMEGKDAVAQDFHSSMRELQPCHLREQEFFVAQNSGSACTIVGRYLTTTDDSAPYFLQVQQRCTFVWELTDDGPKIKHLHVSNPMGELKVAEGKLFVNEMGEMAHKYWLEHLRGQQDARRLSVPDTSDRIWFFTPAEILHATAEAHTCFLYTTSGQKIHARMSIAAFQAAFGADFVHIHRSHVVNSAYISRVEKYAVILRNGTRLPIPVKKYPSVREELLRHHMIPEECAEK